MLRQRRKHSEARCDSCVGPTAVWDARRETATGLAESRHAGLACQTASARGLIVRDVAGRV